MADRVRELLDAYANGQNEYGWRPRDQAPKAFAALRAVLDVVDEMDRVDLFAAYAFRVRTTIRTALEADRG